MIAQVSWLIVRSGCAQGRREGAVALLPAAAGSKRGTSRLWLHGGFDGVHALSDLWQLELAAEVLKSNSC